MKFAIILISILLIIGGVMFFTRSNTDQTPSVSFSSVQQDISTGAKLFDVRTNEEFRSGHFESATNLSLQEIQSGKLPDVPKDTKIFVYCQSGNRSGQATSLLKNAGYTNITDLGGLSSVKSIGGQLITN